MSTLQLVRWSLAPFPTLGRFFHDGDFICYALELPWKDNQPNVSCIPLGTYSLHPGTFKNRYPDYEVEGVPGRFAIEIHRANWPKEIKGCIAPGMSLDTDTWGVHASGAALDKLLELVCDRLTVTVSTGGRIE